MKQYAEIPVSRLNAVIDEWVRNDRNRRIAKRRMIDGICYEPLAEEFGLSTRQVKNIVYKVEETIFKHLDITA